MGKIKKILLTLALTLCILGSAFTFKACKCTDENGNSLSIKNVFAMSMVTASNYLDNTAPQTVGVIDTQTENTIKEYTRMFEGLLSNGIHPTEESVTESDAEYYGVYHKKLSLTLGNESYTMYYCEVLEGTEVEIDDDEIEEETTSFLYGTVVKAIGDDYVTYSVVGSREIESETEKGVTEVESELKLIFTTEELSISHTSKLDDIDFSTFSDYVIIEQEVEDDEIEFEYTTKTPSMVTPKKVEIEFEDEDGEQTLEIKIGSGSTKTKYEIKKVENNKYSVKVKSDGNKVKYYVENTDGIWTMTEA